MRTIGAGHLADMRVWEHRDGVPVAFATIWDGALLLSYMHPHAQRDDLAQQILIWSRARARSRARHCGERAMLFVPICAHDRVGGLLLERQGFVPQEQSVTRREESVTHMPRAWCYSRIERLVAGLLRALTRQRDTARPLCAHHIPDCLHAPPSA